MNNHPIVYMSTPARVNMGDEWFDLASASHFWIRRRFEVLRWLVGRVPLRGPRVAEIGCGTGILRGQMEQAFGVDVDGFDLHDEALARNPTLRGRTYCYDIHHQESSLEKRYESILLFDVLEHVEAEDAFLSSVLFHLAPGGVLYFGVPALPRLYSAYDVAVGHLRRYDARTLREVARRNGLTVLDWTYWGMPLVPFLFLRKIIVRRAGAAILRKGFDAGGRIKNNLLLGLSRAEPIPQRLIGSSLMAALVRTGPGRG